MDGGGFVRAKTIKIVDRIEFLARVAPNLNAGSACTFQPLTKRPPAELNGRGPPDKHLTTQPLASSRSGSS